MPRGEPPYSDSQFRVPLPRHHLLRLTKRPPFDVSRLLVERGGIRSPDALIRVRYSLNVREVEFCELRLLGLLGSSPWKGCRPLRGVRGPAAIGLRLLPEIAPLRSWSGQLLAGLLLSLLLIIMRLVVVRLFLFRFLLGTELGVEHGEYDPHETYQPHPAR